MKLKHLFIILSFSILVATGCENKILPPADSGYNFIPIDTGRYYIYQVDSIRINLTANPYQFDTVHYEMKEFYPYTFLNASNDTVICCTRYYRNADSLPWTPVGSNVWWINRTTTRFEKTEENLTYVKMTYPIDVNTHWNGNAYNILPAQDYYYGQTDIPFNNGLQNFDSTVTVVQRADTSMIDYYFFTETYQRNVGMVHKTKYYIPQLVTSTNQWMGWPYAPLDWYQVPKLKRIRNGSVVIYKLSEYGFE